MAVFSLILSGMAVTLSLCCLIMLRKEHTDTRMRMDTHYAEGYKGRISLKKEIATIAETVHSHAQRLQDLESGVIPDHEQAKEAAKAVDKFNEGIASILNFDPYSAIKEQRTQLGGEGE